ncbi:MAG: zf-TFIIB domain-containing protein [Candidatus Limnocylindrales bacterium]
MACPKDGTSMAPVGRRGRGGAYRCPTCTGVFLDVAAMRLGRARQPMMLAPFVMSVLMSLGMTLLVRRRRHRTAPPAEVPASD